MRSACYCAFILISFTSCADGPTATQNLEPPTNAQTGKPLLDTVPQYRSVGFESWGPPVSGLSSSTAVWDVSRQWDEVSPESGIGWGSNSGLDWDGKYAAWVESMGSTTADDGHITVEITTPWGKTLPSPSLECAEMAMFLRVTFASWYELPFFMTAWSSTYGDIHFGHMGIVDDSGGRISGYPRFATDYEDYTDDMAGQSDAWVVANWPDDGTLETKYLTSAKDDEVAFLGPNAYAGAYFDEVYLNKRVGYFTLKLLVNFGSMHLAGATNTYNLEPEAMSEGDLLIHRWQSSGIGHAMVIKDVEALPGGNIDAEIIYGSMPRIQPVWYGSAIATSYFTSSYGGGPELDANGTPYSHLGGGLKRWRSARIESGSWVNVVLEDDRTDWIGSTDYPNLEARVSTLEAILGDLTPAEARDAILERIHMARENLSQRPASCTNRDRREEAFDDLYTLMDDEWSMTRLQVDETYRDLDDWIFVELEYTASQTCCWNSSTDDMYDIIVEYNEGLVDDAHANNQCPVVVTFRARAGGYDPFESYAAATGQAHLWMPWSEDEPCPQAPVTEDIEISSPFANLCDVYEDMMGYSSGSGCPGGANPITMYVDNDGDGYGNPYSTSAQCPTASGYASTAGDCDDGDADSHPYASEACDGQDNDCDGTVDEGCPGSGSTGSGGTGSTGSGGSSGGSIGGCTCSGSTPVLPLSLPFLGLGLIAARRRL